MGQRPTVCVAEDDDIRSIALRHIQRFEGVGLIGFVSIEEMLGVVNDFLAVLLKMENRVSDDFEVFLFGHMERLFHVEEPRLAENCDDRSLCVEQGFNVRIFAHGILRAARAAECGKFRV